MYNTLINTNINANQRKNDLLHPDLSFVIQGCIFDISKQYGHGHKEVVYQRLLEEKLSLKGLSVEREKRINIYSQDSGRVMGTYQPDLIVEGKIIIEVKSSRLMPKIDEIQLYHYLRNSNYELGYLVNFSTPQLYIKRIIYSNTKKPFIRVV